jgi:hypothetical protein
MSNEDFRGHLQYLDAIIDFHLANKINRTEIVFYYYEQDFDCVKHIFQQAQIIDMFISMKNAEPMKHGFVKYRGFAFFYAIIPKTNQP